MANPFAYLPKYIDLRVNIRKNGEYARVPLAERTEIAIHHSLTSTGSAHSFANYHIDTHGWPGCAYAFVILKNGTIQHADDIDRMTHHVGNSNRFAVGVCLVGDFRTEQPTEAQKESLRHLHAKLVEVLPNYKRTRGHNEYPGYAWKDCPCFDYKAVIEGGPKMSERFNDVPANHWALSSILKAEKAGVISGVGPKEYGLGQPVTREQLAVILDRIGALDEKEAK